MQFFNFDEFSIPTRIYFIFFTLYFLATLWGLFILYKTRKRIRSKFEGINLLLFFVFFIAYVVFYCVNSDYFAYRSWVLEYDLFYFSKEKVYTIIIFAIKSLPFQYPYELFRIVVWGGAVFLVLLSARSYDKKLPLPALIYLFVLYSVSFCYARASLAMSIYILGISIFTNTKVMIAKFLGLAIIGCSLFFHSEMIIGLAVLPLMYLKIESKKMLVRSFVMLAVVSIVVVYLINNLEMLDFSVSEESYSDKVSDFNEKVESGEWSTFRLSHFIQYLLFFLPFVKITTILMKKHSAPLPVLRLYRITFGVILFTLAMMIVFGLRNVFVYRTLFISMIPLSLLMAHFNSNRLLSKSFNVIIFSLSILFSMSQYLLK